MAAVTPHFDLPFRFGSDGHAIVVEQDSLDDVSNCVRAIMLTQLGSRLESPDFGMPDLTFARQPLHLEGVSDAIVAQEPRASALIEQQPDAFEKLAAVVNVSISVAPRQEASQ